MIAAPDLRVIGYRIIRVAVAPPALLARLPVVPRRQRGCHLILRLQREVAVCAFWKTHAIAE
jgi:hypothetical protein